MMPERTMSEAVERLEDAVEHIDMLVVEVRSLQQSKRRYRIMLVGLAAVMALGAGTVVYTTHRFNDARVEGCQNRNDAARVTRVGFERLVSFVSGFVDNPEFMEGLIATLPRQDETELDCDGDDKLTEADYPPTGGFD
jgi:hypothetical protein